MDTLGVRVECEDIAITRERGVECKSLRHNSLVKIRFEVVRKLSLHEVGD